MPDEMRDEGEISLIDIAVVIAESWIVLVLVPLIAAGLTFAALTWLDTPQYRSEAIVRLSEEEAMLVTSARVLDTAITSSSWAQHHPGRLSAAREQLAQSLSVSAIGGTGTYSITLTAAEPELADPTLEAIIAALIEASAPTDAERGQMELRLETLERSLANLQSSLDRLDQLYEGIGSGSMSAAVELGNLGTSLVALNTQIASTEEAILSAKFAMEGSVSASDVIQPPTALDTSNLRSRSMSAILAGLGVGFVLLIGVFIRAGLRGAASDPSSAAKLDRIRKAFWLPPKHSESP